MTPDEFYIKLRAYCDHYGASVSSYGREIHYNAAVGGVGGSPHRFWQGADVRYLWQLTEREIQRVRERFGAEWAPPAPVPDADRIRFAHLIGLRLIVENDHDHLQPFAWAAG